MYRSVTTSLDRSSSRRPKPFSQTVAPRTSDDDGSTWAPTSLDAALDDVSIVERRAAEILTALGSFAGSLTGAVLTEVTGCADACAAEGSATSTLKLVLLKGRCSMSGPARTQVILVRVGQVQHSGHIGERGVVFHAITTRTLCPSG